MLEIKDLTKVYKTKGGVETRALDGVSLKFEERGMVFLLGKSGSGKSTLLNLCGGLDTPDSGEIIIKGRSSKDFSQADFDSYRNTFVGFVFQEYNILNEFTVEDNIALALELQGKNKDKARVHEILEQVEMTNFAKRKPNTLSGGQKQRIAIARALVKNPEIIMADEPTGALDSNTGKQVFDTLKKLSQDKLVLVVSHDREFAEIYGDRIIELKDGHVISDVMKTKIAAVAASENLTYIGEDTLSVKSGAALTAADMEQIRKFLAKTPGSVILSNGEKEITDFKKAARIDESGAREAFRATDASAIQSKSYKPEDSRFIRSKLPARHALRIGASGMKAKPFRLFFTIFLSFIAFTMFGLFSTLTFYDEKSVTLETYQDSDYEFLMLQNNYWVDYVTYRNGKEQSRRTSSNTTLFTPADLQKYSSEYGEAVGLYNFNDYDYYSFNIRNVRNYPSGSYYRAEVKYFAEVSDQTNLFELVTDTDLSDLGEDGIVISSYLFDTLKELTLTDENGNEIELNEYSDIVGKPLYLDNNVPLTVKGVYRLDLPSQYDPLKDGQSATDAEDKLSEALESDLSYGMYCTVLVSEDFYDAQRNAFGSRDIPIFEYLSTYMRFQDADNAQEEPVFYGNFDSIAAYTENNVAYFPYTHLFGGRDSVKSGEIVIDVSYILNIISNFYYISYDEFIETNRDNIEKYAEEHRDEILLEMIHGDFSYLFDQYKNEFIETYRSEHFKDYRLQYYLSYYKDHYKTEYDGYFQQYKQDNPGATDEEAANHADEMALSTGYKEDANIWAIDQAEGRIASECATPAAEYAEEKAMADEQVTQSLPTYTQNMFYQANHPQYNDKYNGDLIWRYESILRSGRYDSDDGTYYAKESDYAEAIAFFRDFINDYSDYYDFSLPQVSLIDENTSIAYGTDFTVAGVYCGMEGRSSILFSQSDCDALLERYGQDQGSSYTASETKYERTADARYNLIAMRFPDRGTLSSIVYGSKAEDTEDDSFYTLYSGITMSLNQVNSMIGTFEQIFLWVGLVMALFSMLLLFNFISVSISYKKKEIGILRAVGARSADVFKIFYSESAIIAAICFVLAMVASFITCGILNNTLAGQLGVSIFVFGPLSWLVMLGIAVVTSIIATFLPVYGIAKRRPVESIRAL